MRAVYEGAAVGGGSQTVAAERLNGLERDASYFLAAGSSLVRPLWRPPAIEILRVIARLRCPPTGAHSVFTVTAEAISGCGPRLKSDPRGNVHKLEVGIAGYKFRNDAASAPSGTGKRWISVLWSGALAGD